MDVLVEKYENEEFALYNSSFENEIGCISNTTETTSANLEVNPEESPRGTLSVDLALVPRDICDELRYHKNYIICKVLSDLLETTHAAILNRNELSTVPLNSNSKNLNYSIAFPQLPWQKFHDIHLIQYPPSLAKRITSLRGTCGKTEKVAQALHPEEAIGNCEGGDNNDDDDDEKQIPGETEENCPNEQENDSFSRSESEPEIASILMEIANQPTINQGRVSKKTQKRKTKKTSNRILPHIKHWLFRDTGYFSQALIPQVHNTISQIYVFFFLKSITELMKLVSEKNLYSDWNVNCKIFIKIPHTWQGKENVEITMTVSVDLKNSSATPNIPFPESPVELCVQLNPKGPFAISTKDFVIASEDLLETPTTGWYIPSHWTHWLEQKWTVAKYLGIGATFLETVSEKIDLDNKTFLKMGGFSGKIRKLSRDLS